MKKIVMVCSVCGSRDVRRDGTLEWSVEAQDWVVAGVLDSADCEDCFEEVDLKAVDVA